MLLVWLDNNAYTFLELNMYGEDFDYPKFQGLSLPIQSPSVWSTPLHSVIYVWFGVGVRWVGGVHGRGIWVTVALLVEGILDLVVAMVVESLLTTMVVATVVVVCNGCSPSGMGLGRVVVVLAAAVDNSGEVVVTNDLVNCDH
ncbi:regulator of nonsense transcripts 1 homolog [Olea europaea subsp. europaea]|uniref:Regulator of nonsense transcripts 1 homolog n=1 Tax=Olea europaea subsp. europaea TaxID=158383 RepID=A0A8S0R6W1_OLEEU|nr:regulator of nonsense transcripts 1 homolog [Olea europaea subsp. europaea]